MIIDITYDNGKHYQTTSLNRTITRKITELILNEFEVKEKYEVKTRKLIFADGEWNVLLEAIDKVYRDIIKSYVRNIS